MASGKPPNPGAEGVGGSPQVRLEEPISEPVACHEVEDDPTARVFYEPYRDRSAFDAHEQQPHVRRFLAEREQYMAAGRVLSSFVCGPVQAFRRLDEPWRTVRRSAPFRYPTYRDNYARLVEVKNRYDPTNLFHVNQNIKPTT